MEPPLLNAVETLECCIGQNSCFCTILLPRLSLAVSDFGLIMFGGISNSFDIIKVIHGNKEETNAVLKKNCQKLN